MIKERRNRTFERDAMTFLKRLWAMNIVIDPAPPSARPIALARGHTLTVYNASHLKLAMREDVPPAAVDTRLAAAAEVVPLIG